MSAWDDISEDELRTAAKVAAASGGEVMEAAATAWIMRADLMRANNWASRSQAAKYESEPVQTYEDQTWTMYDPRKAQDVAIFYDKEAAELFAKIWMSR